MSAGEFKITRDERNVLVYVLHGEKRSVVSTLPQAVKSAVKKGWLRDEWGNGYVITELGHTIMRQLGIGGHK